MTIYSELSAPIAAKLEITSNCNNHCKFCYNVWKERDVPKPVDMPSEKLKAVIDELAELGVMVLNITGGEPFLRKDVFSILGHAKKRNFIVFINTNGNLIDEKCARALKRLKINGVTVSLHGLERLHDRITRTRGSFSKAIRGIKTLIRHDIPVKANFVLSRENYRELRGVLGYLSGIGLKSVSIGRVVPRNRALRCLELTKTAWISTLKDLAYAEMKFGINTKIMTAVPYCFSNSRFLLHRCLAGLTWFLVTPDGKIKKCGHDFQSVGDVTKGSLKDAWAALKDERELHFMSEKCSGCPDAGVTCMGGCKIIARVHGGKEDPLMNMRINIDDGAARGTYEASMFSVNDMARLDGRAVVQAVALGTKLKFPRQLRLRKESFGGVIFWNVGAILNRTGHEALELLLKGMSVAEVSKSLARKYCAPVPDVSRAVSDFTRQLIDFNIAVPA